MRYCLQLLLYIFCLSFNEGFSQKQAYIPNFLLNSSNPNAAQFSWDKTYQSPNFVIVWGNTVGANPVTYSDPDLAFDPASIASYLENSYTIYKNLGFLVDLPSTLRVAQFKIPIVMNNTWGTNPDAITGFKNASFST
jgi:hypothetical protein